MAKRAILRIMMAALAFVLLGVAATVRTYPESPSPRPSGPAPTGPTQMLSQAVGKGGNRSALSAADRFRTSHLVG